MGWLDILKEAGAAKKGLTCVNHPAQAMQPLCGVQFCFQTHTQMHNVHEKKRSDCPSLYRHIHGNRVQASKGTDTDRHYKDLVRERLICDILKLLKSGIYQSYRLLERTYLPVDELHLCSTKQKQN